MGGKPKQVTPAPQHWPLTERLSGPGLGGDAFLCLDRVNTSISPLLYASYTHTKVLISGNYQKVFLLYGNLEVSNFPGNLHKVWCWDSKDFGSCKSIAYSPQMMKR